jgi:hypothetical protein
MSRRPVKSRLRGSLGGALILSKKKRGRHASRRPPSWDRDKADSWRRGKRVRQPSRGKAQALPVQAPVSAIAHAAAVGKQRAAPIGRGRHFPAGSPGETGTHSRTADQGLPAAPPDGALCRWGDPLARWFSFPTTSDAHRTPGTRVGYGRAVVPGKSGAGLFTNLTP